MPKCRVLVIDGEEASRSHLRRFFEQRGFAVECLDSVEKALEQLAATPPSVVIADISLSGITALEELPAIAPAARLIAISQSAHPGLIIRATRLRAVDFLIKPLKDEDLQQAISDCTGHTRWDSTSPDIRKPPANESSKSRPATCFGYSTDPQLRHIAEIAARVAATDVPVLISGESGVGKDVLANFIHSASSRRDQPFVSVNCAAIPADLLESELFGHERGAFTGAVERKPGRFEMANGGSILLDEIGDMALALQGKLLQVLQNHEFSRLGATHATRINSRVLAATNKPLERAVSRGEFREDLFFRLNVVRIRIPPLREHLQDVPALCNYFVEKYSSQYCGDEMVELPSRLREAFCAYHWPGNVRQLENVIRQFLILREEELALGSLSDAGTECATDDLPGVPAGEPHSLKDVGAEAAEQAEKELVMRILGEEHWNRKRVARELGVSYKTLLSKLHRWEKDKLQK